MSMNMNVLTFFVFNNFNIYNHILTETETYDIVVNDFDHSKLNCSYKVTNAYIYICMYVHTYMEKVIRQCCMLTEINFLKRRAAGKEKEGLRPCQTILFITQQ